MKIILDTNVIIAAFATRGLCSAVFELCLDRFDVVLSEAILEETQKHLHGKIKLPVRQCHLIMTYLKQNALISEADEPSGLLCMDPNDLHVLGLAKRSTSDYIITGDKDLLDLARFEGTQIIAPRAFWELLKK
jgi:putative PIN family toxin of toxin-antitoxin system